MLPIQGGNKGGMALLGTGAKCVVVWIWRNVYFSTNCDKLCFLPQQVDDLADKVSSNTEPLRYSARIAP
jgi:hypothetical protein